MFSSIQKCVKIHQLNIIKQERKTTEKARESYSSLSRKEKEKKQQNGCEQKSTRKWKKKFLEYRKKIKQGKSLNIIIRIYFHLEKFVFSWGWAISVGYVRFKGN